MADSGGAAPASLLDQQLSFAEHDFGLDVRLTKAVAKMGFVHPTLVQSKSLPILMKGRDLLMRARTGSGKTAAYALPALQKVLEAKGRGGAQPGVRVVVLCPAKELVDQTVEHLRGLLRYAADAVSICGLAGATMAVQKARLHEYPDVVVATPGRLVAHLRKGNVVLDDTLQTLVIDEADMALAYGGSADVQTVARRMPRICQCVLVSATLSEELDALKRLVLRKPAVLKLEEDERDGQLMQFAVRVREADKELLLYALLQLRMVHGRTLVFVSSVERCYHVKLFLEKFSINAAVLNAELPANSRRHIIDQFNRGAFDILITTDDGADETGSSAALPAARAPKKTAKAAAEEEAVGDSSKSDKKAAAAGGSDDDEEEEDEDEGDEDEDEEGEDGDEALFGGSSSEEEDGEEGSEDDEEGEDDGEAAAAEAALLKRGRVVPPMDAGKGGDEAADGDAEGDNGAAAASNPRKRPRRRRQRGPGDSEFGVARGMDFKGVSTVLNLDFPRTAAAYVHRVGRTARGGRAGTALSFVAEEAAQSWQVLEQVRGELPPDQSGNPQPGMLPLDIAEVEGFRYRVEDMKTLVTTKRVREARQQEIRQEILNSQRLGSHFEDNPADLQLLRHDSALRPIEVLPHLATVPSYLMPAAMKGGGEEKDARADAQPRKRKRAADPLKTLSLSARRLAPRGGRGRKAAMHGLTSTGVGAMVRGVGASNSGRNRWKAQHKKGEFRGRPGRGGRGGRGRGRGRGGGSR